MSTLSERMADWLRQRVADAHARGIVVGLSGGVDSAVVARISQLAVPGSVLGVILPAYSDARDERDARLVAEHFSIPTIGIDLSGAYDGLVMAAQRALEDRRDLTASITEKAGRLSLANVKPRLRMTTLYFVANRLNYLVAGTGNRSEIAIGYYTKYGDGGVDLLPLGELLKSQVRALAREVGVPDSIIEKAPSAGLWLGQTDEGEMGFTYADLEAYLVQGADAVSRPVAAKIETLVKASAHKRDLPPVFPLS